MSIYEGREFRSLREKKTAARPSRGKKKDRGSEKSFISCGEKKSVLGGREEERPSFAFRGKGSPRLTRPKALIPCQERSGLSRRKRKESRKKRRRRVPALSDKKGTQLERDKDYAEREKRSGSG